MILIEQETIMRRPATSAATLVVWATAAELRHRVARLAAETRRTTKRAGRKRASY